MKNLYCPLLILSLAACATDNTLDKTYSYTDRYDPTIEIPYANLAHESNKKVTSMISTTADQLNRYIAAKLGGYTGYPPINAYDDIANMAVWLTSQKPSASDIEDKYYENMALLHQAMYVINKDLARCVNIGSSYGKDAGTCFVNWRKNNEKQFNEAKNNILENAYLIDIRDAQFVTNDDTVLKFTLADGQAYGGDGKITAIVVNDEQYNRIDDTNKFENENSILTYNSVGRDLGLSFSDFGTYDILTKNQDTGDVTQHIATDVPFAGGYESQQIFDIANDVQFTGRAVGTASNENQVVDLAGNATLNFDKDSGISTLGAQFDNWYDIVVKNDDTGSITFTNYKNAYDQVKLGNTPGADGVISSTGAKMDVHYYGYVPESGIPTEAAGLVQWTESPGGAKMDIAFGAK